MNYSHPTSDIGKVKGLLNRCIAAPYHRHFLPLIKKPVACSAAGHPPTHEQFLRGQPQILSRSTGCNDQCITGVSPLVSNQCNGLARELRGVDVIKNDLRVKSFRVLLEALH